MKCEEMPELITALVDGELSGPERPSVENHLKDCPKCRWAFEEERALKRAIRAAGDKLRAPVGLKERILSDHRVFPQRTPGSGWKDYFWPIQYIPRPAFVVAFLLIFALSTFYWLNQRKPSIALAALETHEMLLRGDFPITKAKDAEEIREQLTHAVNGEFAPMEYDLSSMNVRPVGGTVREFKGRKILVTVYKGEGIALTCFTFLGTEADAPKNAGVFFDREKKINFYTFSSGGAHAVLHRDGNLICILVSEMPMEKLLGLAKGKIQPQI